MTPRRRTTTAIIIPALVLVMRMAPDAGSQESTGLRITVRSSRPDMVSGGNALIEITTPSGVVPAQIVVTLNGRNVTSSFRVDGRRPSLVGLVEGLAVGTNVLMARAGSRRTTLELRNHPITGPIVSGEHLKPFECRTIESGLGPPLDANCTAATKVEYFYRSSDAPAAAGARGVASPGSFNALPEPLTSRPLDLAYTTTIDGIKTPYIVRVESGTINRGIYRIAILDDPAARPGGAVWAPGAGWNRRLIVTFGGGCAAGYHQGSSQATAALFDPALSRGFAHVISTQNVLQLHCNDQLSGEALMMIKEHFIERYGVPDWVMGFGGSGGAIQQLLIAQNFPGLLNGLVPGLTFPDSNTVRPGSTDCRLLVQYFAREPARWPDTRRSAVEGFTAGTCASWDRSFSNNIVADFVPGCGIRPDQIYSAASNPNGARCTTWDTNVATFGRDPATGFARRSLDNVGVQYGLRALQTGTITADDFIHLNTGIGGFDNDGHVRAERTRADPDAVRLAYAAGRVNTGKGLDAIPILHIRPYLDLVGDIHSRERDFSVRARLVAANGHADNQVIWTFPSPYPSTSLGQPLAFGLAIDTMTQWLDALAADRSPAAISDKVRRSRPSAAADACWDAAGTKIVEPAAFDGTGRCNTLYPVHANPRLVAGTPIADDVLTCRLKPIAPADYGGRLTAGEVERLRRVFPEGVCDFSKPGVAQQLPVGTYLTLPLRK